jgi:hypothetical protein
MPNITLHYTLNITKKLHNPYPLPVSYRFIIRNLIEEDEITRHAYTILGGNEKISFEKSWCKWENNITVDVVKVVCRNRNWTGLADTRYLPARSEFFSTAVNSLSKNGSTWMRFISYVIQTHWLYVICARPSPRQPGNQKDGLPWWRHQPGRSQTHCPRKGHKPRTAVTSVAPLADVGFTGQFLTNAPELLRCA